MYKLYYLPGACSMAVHIALNEIGVEFELINVATLQGQLRSKVLLDINPRGSVPVLEIDNFILREGAAILIYLFDSNANNLLPKSGLERAKTLEWLSFANSSLHPAYGRIFMMMKFFGKDASKNEFYSLTIAQIQKYWDEIEDHLKDNEYVAGNQITIADILIAVIANWSSNFEAKINFGNKTKSYFDKIVARPSFCKALEAEGVAYVANL
jgi:glutathione S-transferase